MSDVTGARCPNTFCNVTLLPLADQVEINRIAAAEGKLHTTHPLAGFTFTYQGKKLCHACSEMYKAVIGKTWWINAQADEISAPFCRWCDMLSESGKKCSAHREQV